MKALILCIVSSMALGQGMSNSTGGGSSGITALTGDVSASGTGSVAATVAGAASAAGIFASAVASGSKAFSLLEGALLSFNGSAATSYIKGDASTHGIDFISNVSNVSGSAYIFDTTNAVSTPMVFTWKVHGSSIATLDTNAQMVLTGGNIRANHYAASDAFGLIADGLEANSAVAVTIAGQQADGASAIGVKIRAGNTLSTLGAKIASFQNNTTEKLSVDKDGNIQSASHLSCAMSAGTTCTATVPSGSVCNCQATAGSASALSCAVSSTIATCTASASNSSTWNVFVY